MENVNDCAPVVQDYSVAEVIAHPQYNTPPLENDIGLIRINGEANMDSGMQIKIHNIIFRKINFYFENQVTKGGTFLAF